MLGGLSDKILRSDGGTADTVCDPIEKLLTLVLTGAVLVKEKLVEELIKVLTLFFSSDVRKPTALTKL